MNINIRPDGAIKRVHVSQNDVGRTLTFELFNNSTSYTIPSGATVKIQGTKPSGFGFSETCTVSGNVVTVDTTSGMTDEYGYIDTELSISYSGYKIGTSNFVLAVEKNPHPDTTTDGSMDTIIPELTLLVNEVKGYAEEIEDTYHAYGSPWVASTVAQMTDTNKIYVYVGSESGYTNGNWYYYNGTAWVSGGVYNAVAIQTDTTLSVSGMPADAKVVGDEVGELKNDLGLVDYHSFSDGYFNTDGSIISPSHAEKYTSNYIPIIGGETLSVTIELTIIDWQWARWMFYDENKNVIGNGTQSSTRINPLVLSITIPETATYFRISFRTFNKLSKFVVERNTSVIEDVSAIQSKIDNLAKEVHRGDFISICHQGYSETDTLGHCLLEGYPLARKMGFDWGECDLKMTSDDVLVCAHDSTFVDGTTSETIRISEHTLAELQECNYYGATIATFDDVVRTCKLNGMGLVIDQIYYGLVAPMFAVVRKYGMQRRVAYLVSADNIESAETLYNMISNHDANAHIMVIPSNVANDENAVLFCNSIKTATNNVELSLNYATHSVADVLSLQAQLNEDINIVMWTIDAKSTCINYLPYVTAITSNKISRFDLFE